MALDSYVGMASMATGSVELRSLENPRVSLQDPEAWDAFYGSDSKSDSGVKVTPDKSLSIAAVWQAVNMISGDIARLPLDVYKRGANDEREADKKHPAWRICRRRWNPEITAFRGWRTIVAHALLWGNGYAFIDQDGLERPLGLYPLLPDRTSTWRDPETKRLHYITETSLPNGKPWLRPLELSQVLHVAGLPTGDGTLGAKLVKAARHAWGLALARQKFESKFFRHGVRSGGILELPLGSDEQFQNNVTEGFKRHHEGEDAWFKTIVLRDGVKFQQTSFNAQEAQLDESSERSAREVARYFNMAPSRLGVEGSVGYNSQESDAQSYLDRTLAVWLADIVAECGAKLLSAKEQESDSHYFEHNAGPLLSMNLLQRYQAYAIAVRNRWYTPNDVLRKENEPTKEWGDEPVPVPGSAGGADKGENAKPRGPEKDVPDEDAERQLLARRIMFGLCRHAREKAGKGHRSFCEWIAGGLVSHRNEAKQLVGSDEIVDRFSSAMDAVQSVAVSEMPVRVDAIAGQLEREF